MVLQQFGGLNGYAYYMNEIFELAGKNVTIMMLLMGHMKGYELKYNYKIMGL